MVGRALDDKPSETTVSEPTVSAPPIQDDAPPPAAAIVIDPDRPGLRFASNFVDADSLSDFEFGIQHRDDRIVSQETWPGDHPIIGPGDLCGPPTEKRDIARGERDSGFNNDWIYRCVPGGDLEKAHIMTSIGDTSGYSIGAFTPKVTFADVREVRWDVNLTDLGARQWTEVALIPSDRFSFDDLPCSNTCGASTHGQLDAVATGWAGLGARSIITPDDSFREANNELGYSCSDCPFGTGRRFGTDYAQDDPSITSIAIRRQNYFRDNGDGTLTWGLELDDGSFDELTVPGSFPDGPVRVVFKDHSYTPMKAPSTALAETTFTWHWDNIEVDVTGTE